MGLEVSFSAAFDDYEGVIDIAYPKCWFKGFEGGCLELLKNNFSDVARNRWMVVFLSFVKKCSADLTVVGECRVRGFKFLANHLAMLYMGLP